MTIHLPIEIEQFLKTAVHAGRFSSMDEAMTEAARLLLDQLCTAEQLKQPDSPDPILGIMRDDAPMMDEIAEDASRHRNKELWREVSL